MQQQCNTISKMSERQCLSAATVLHKCSKVVNSVLYVNSIQYIVESLSLDLIDSHSSGEETVLKSSCASINYFMNE